MISTLNAQQLDTRVYYHTIVVSRLSFFQILLESIHLYFWFVNLFRG